MTLPPNRRRRWSGSKNQFFPASYLFLCFFPRKISKLVRMARTEIKQVRDTQNQQLQVDQVETRDDAELLPDVKVETTDTAVKLEGQASRNFSELTKELKGATELDQIIRVMQKYTEFSMFPGARPGNYDVIYVGAQVIEPSDDDEFLYGQPIVAKLSLPID